MNIIKELRKKKGIQQKELAIAIGVSRPTVSEWESNKKDPSGERLKKLAAYFDVDELTILGKGIQDMQFKYDPALSISERLRSMEDSNAPEGKELYKQLIDMLVNIPQDQIQRVLDFVAGMRASNKE